MNIKTILIIVAAQTVLIAATVAGTWMLFLNTQSGAAAVAEGEAESIDSAGEPSKKDLKDPVYMSLEPAFVVNLQDGNSLRFLQVQVDLMSRDAADFEKVEKYGVRVRNDLLMLFGSVTRDDLMLPNGTTDLQKSALDTVNNVLKQESGKGSVEAVYFSKFVMQ
ncbi:MAG TPA: hypothetical protein DIW43_09705 [Spongiibacteraceae bacterium]|nr:hypothetical protein [Spongiibacteraceae bacterium]HCS27718.1 hypothetical protein [Spongiibacteraceae bacterium]